MTFAPAAPEPIATLETLVSLTAKHGLPTCVHRGGTGDSYSWMTASGHHVTLRGATLLTRTFSPEYPA